MSIRDEFNTHGVSSAERTTEHVAFLLLIYSDWNYLRTLRGIELQHALEEHHLALTERYRNLTIPQPPPVAQWGNESLVDLFDQLENAIADEPLQIYFQRKLRWELLKETSGAQYPTPFHIASLMATLGVTQPNANILDPAMGTAGLLVAALVAAPNATLTGADFDPIWAGMGCANLILHGKGAAQVFVGSALTKFAEWEGRFDTVLMNPPFGGSRGAGEIVESVGPEYGRNNATVMGALAIKVLRPGGRSLFLTPSGTLFAGRGAEANLKTAILAENLEAIITLPKRAFYPFSNVEAHLIVVRKRLENEDIPSNPIWFCQIETDGYPEGSERDLTVSANIQSDELPRVQALIVNTRQPDTWQTQFALDGIGAIQTTRLSPPNGLPGFGLRIDGLQSTPKWELLSFTDSCLVKIYDQQAQLQAWFSIQYTEGHSTAITKDHINPQVWSQMLSRVDWADNVVGQWKNETVDSTLEVQAGDHPGLELKQGKTVYNFGPDATHSEIACLLGANGQPQTPWFHVIEPKKIRESEFGERYLAIPLQDAREIQIGWLLEHKQVPVDAVNPMIGRMLILFQDQVDLYEQDGAGFGFAYHGYFRINFEGFVFQFEQGQPLPQREGVEAVGFAIGPTAGAGKDQRIFAVLLGRTAFTSGDDLRPNRFLPEPQAVPIQLPASVLANIRKNQTKFNEKVSSLLSILGDVSKKATRNNRAYPVPDWITGMLDDQQQVFLQTIASHQNNGYSAHFNKKDVLTWKNGISGSSTYSDADALMQLELFIRMGLIMKVHSEGENLYRCLTYQDVLKPQIMENPEGNHEAA